MVSMFINYWLDRSGAIVETEVVLVKQSASTKDWFDKMPKQIPAIASNKKILNVNDFRPKVGHAHTLRMTRWGIEAVLIAPRKFQRYNFYVLYDQRNQPNEPFWVIFHRDLVT